MPSVPLRGSRLPVVVIVILLAGVLAIQPRATTAAIPQGPYLGQEPPGRQPKIFAPGIVSTEQAEFAGTLSPDGREFHFTRRPTFDGSDNRLYVAEQRGTGWTSPAPVPFGTNSMEFESFVSPDNKLLFFDSGRPRPAGAVPQGSIWCVERTATGWGPARHVGAAVNGSHPMSVSAALNGTLYFTGLVGRQFGIWRAPRAGDDYSGPEYLPIEVNSLRGAHPYIAPDESYLIFDAADGNTGPILSKKALFISYRNPDGSWTSARKLPPEINTTQTEFCPHVSPDGRFLFFTRTVGKSMDIWWVEAGFIGELQPPDAPR